MGDALRRLHAIPAAGLTLDEEASAPSTTEVLSRIEALLGVIPVVAPGDRAANEHLKSRARWLEAQGDYHPSGQRHSQLVHGDYIDANLFFHDGDVSAVIDWDAAHHGSAQHELMRSAHYSLRDNGELWAAFLRAYVAGQPLDLEQLDAAAKAYAYRRDRSLWQFEEFYLRGNAAVRQYLPSATFVPWIERWRRIRAHLA